MPVDEGEDLAFLEYVRSCKDVEELRLRRRMLPTKAEIDSARKRGYILCDEWKVIALERAMARLGSTRD